ncbi:hypothetical protein RHMOL_Rhmol11G0087800 [Rhododendron molle]|uniref:Uncharacterized protein n=1 Tax=Rhododendron molle TaxID=49168 RepID=A0ACC0LR43_RHOML|nr:hypothetical protein RHMOL_Rhmol11G0087800 [Rhododendron molle]
MRIVSLSGTSPLENSEHSPLPATLNFRPLSDIVHSDIKYSNSRFGFDKSTDYYKVVLIREIVYGVKDMPMVDDVCVHVYSPSTNTWRHLNSFLSPECLRRCFGIGAYSDGVYYWWAGTGVLAFDIGNEVFRVISVPFILPSGVDKCDVKPYNGDRIALYQFKGFPESGIDKCCDIWVMEEDSWIKHFTVGPIHCRAFQQGFWKNGELLFLKLILGSYNRHGCWVFQLVLYNPSTRELRYLGPKEDFIGYQALVYHESLVSVNGGIHQTKDKLSDSSAILLQMEPIGHNYKCQKSAAGDNWDFRRINLMGIMGLRANIAFKFGLNGHQLGTKLSDVVTNKSDALGLFDLFRDEGYILTEHEGRFCVCTSLPWFPIRSFFWEAFSSSFRPPTSTGCTSETTLLLSRCTSETTLLLSSQYHYSKDSGELKLELEDPVRDVRWCSVDPYPSPDNMEMEKSKFPLYFDGPKPFEH